MWEARKDLEKMEEVGVCTQWPAGHARLPLCCIDGTVFNKQTYKSPWISCQLEMRPFPIKIQVPHFSWGKRFDNSQAAWQQLAAAGRSPPTRGFSTSTQTVHQLHSRRQLGLSGHCNWRTLDNSFDP